MLVYSLVVLVCIIIVTVSNTAGSLCVYRQNPRLANVLNKVVHINSGSTSSNADAVDVIAAAPDLFVSHDRFAVYRATILSAPAAREEETAEAVGCDSRESRSTAQKLEYSTGSWTVDCIQYSRYLK